MVSNSTGSLLFVATTAGSQNDVPAGAVNAVFVLSPSTGAVIKKIPLPASPSNIVINPAGDHLYATATDPSTGAQKLLSVNLSTSQVVTGSFPGVPFDLYAIGVSADGATLFVPVSSKVFEYTASTLHAAGSVPIPETVVAPPLATPDGKSIIFSTSTHVYVLNLASQSFSAIIAISSGGAAVFGDALSPDGQTVYVNGASLVAVSLPTLSVLGSAATHLQNPYRLGVSRDGATLYAADLTASTVTVVDASALTVTAIISSLAPPYAVAFDASGNTFVLNENGSRAVAVDTTVLRALSVAPVGSRPTQALTTPSGTAFIMDADSGNLAAIVGGVHPSAITPVSLPNLIIPASFTYLNGNVYTNSGAAVLSVNATSLQLNGAFAIPLPGSFYTVNQIASSPATGLLYGTYVQGALDSGIIGGGLVLFNLQTHAAQYFDTSTFVGGPLVISADGHTVYTIGSDLELTPTNTVQSYSGGSHFVSKTFTSASFTALHLSRDGKTLYVLDKNGFLDLLDTATLELTTSLPVGVKPVGIGISADGTEAIITDQNSFSITVVDLLNNVIRGTVAVGGTSAAATYLN